MADHPQPVHSVEPDVDTPDADLIAWPAELTELGLVHERFEAAWPKGETAVNRAAIGRRLEDVLEDLAEIPERIADLQPRTLAGAAVLLRRAPAAIGDPGRLEARLVGAALGQAVGLTFQQIQKCERGSNRIGSGRLFRFAEALDVPLPFPFDAMPEEVAGRPPSASDAQVAGGEEDQMSRRETLELVRGYDRISNPGDGKRAREFVKLISDLAAGAEEEDE